MATIIPEEKLKAGGAALTYYSITLPNNNGGDPATNADIIIRVDGVVVDADGNSRKDGNLKKTLDIKDCEVLKKKVFTLASGKTLTVAEIAECLLMSYDGILAGEYKYVEPEPEEEIL